MPSYNAQVTISGAQPILDPQTGHVLKMLSIVRHHRQVVRSSARSL